LNCFLTSFKSLRILASINVPFISKVKPPINSSFTNDIQVICLLLKYKIITDYCCSIKKCKVKTLWLDKPIQLILHRKNNIENDLSSFNLELICGNCYLCMFGLDIFKKKEKEIVFKCNICNFPLVQFNNQRKKKGTCLACEKKMSNLFTKNIEGEYYANDTGTPKKWEALEWYCNSGSSSINKYLIRLTDIPSRLGLSELSEVLLNKIISILGLSKETTKKIIKPRKDNIDIQSEIDDIDHIFYKYAKKSKENKVTW
jgi:hypothetical protein